LEGVDVECSRCGAENREGRRFCASCGGPLSLRCSSCHVDNEVGERYCGGCGAQLELPRSGHASGAGPASLAPAPRPSHAEVARASDERRLATVLFCDLTGFTSMSEGMDPEDLKALASHCAEIMSEEVWRFGGTVTSIMGDSIMGVFGAPVAHEDDPERAVRAVMSIRERLRSVSGAPKPIEIHAGVNTGETMTGLVGPSGRQDYTAMGDTTNTAARLMSAAPTGQILVGELTHLATRHAVRYREAGSIVAKGKSAPVLVWEVVDVAPIPATRPLGTAPFVGRREELGAIGALWERVRHERRVRAASVVGAAGIGKTRLLRESVDGLPEVAHVYWGRCLAYGEGITYWPVIEIIKSAAGIRHDDDLEVESAKLGALLESLSSANIEEVRSMATALANLLAVPMTPRGTYEATSIAKGELHWAIGRVLEALAAEGPTIIVFEDLHWAEPTLLELVASLGRSAAEVPLLVLATARPEVVEWGILPPGDGHLTLRLEGLDDEESQAILADLLGSGATAIVRGEVLLRNAQGNPLFLEEIVRMLVSAGALEDGGLNGDLADIPIPSSVQGLIGSRLDMLPIEQRRVAQHGSILGQVLWPGAVAHVGQWSEGVEEDLDGLVSREMLETHDHSSVAGEREYAFRHILIRDVAYGRLPRHERAVLHERCAEWIAGLPGGKDNLIELVAYHLEQACALAPAFGPAAETRPVRQAVSALVAAADKAEHREGIREAHRFYVRALELVGVELPELAVELRLKRARMTAELGELSRADEEFRAVAEEARRLGRVDLRGHALVALANVHLKEGRASEAGAWLVEAQVAAMETNDRWLRVRASYEFAALRGDFAGDVEGAIKELRRAVAGAVQLGDRALRVEGLLRVGNLLVNLGHLAEAQRELSLCVKLAGQLGSRRDEARATYLLGLVTFYRVGAEEADDLGLRTHTWLERIGDGYFLTQSLRALAKYALATGRPEVAEERLRQALPLVADDGGWLVVEIYRYLTQALVEQDKIAEAEEAAARAREAVPEEDAYARAAALLSTSLVLTADPPADAAWQGFTESIAIMEEQNLWLDLAEARILYASSLARRGRVSEAEAQLEGARRLFEPMGADAMLASIDQQLALLRDTSRR
jgi:class 3 adenylate cyclase/tetratricopeptide (TPR) repeat protein